MYVRRAAAEEMAEVGEVRVRAYREGGFLSTDSKYAPMLRDLGADGAGLVLVAVAPVRPARSARSAESAVPADAAGGRGTRPAERIVGTVMLQPWPDAGPTVRGPGEAEIRALAVRPEAQGSGTGTLLLREVIGAAKAAAIRHLILCTEPGMRAAQHLYDRAGFVRLPERDWSPSAHSSLLVYGLRLG